MKANFFLLVALAMIVLSGCESNMPEWNDNGRNKLVGSWRVVKETVTNGDGFGGVVTRTEDFHWGIDSYISMRHMSLYGIATRAILQTCRTISTR